LKNGFFVQALNKFSANTKNQPIIFSENLIWFLMPATAQNMAAAGVCI